MKELVKNIDVQIEYPAHLSQDFEELFNNDELDYPVLSRFLTLVNNIGQGLLMHGGEITSRFETSSTFVLRQTHPTHQMTCKINIDLKPSDSGKWKTNWVKYNDEQFDNFVEAGCVIRNQLDSELTNLN